MNPIDGAGPQPQVPDFQPEGEILGHRVRVIHGGGGLLFADDALRRNVNVVLVAVFHQGDFAGGLPPAPPPLLDTEILAPKMPGPPKPQGG